MTTPGVSGYEQPVQEVVRDYAAGFAESVTTDLHGNVIATVNPDAPLRIMLAGHCDQLGLLVSYIDEAGFVFFQTVGGWDPQQLVGTRVTVCCWCLLDRPSGNAVAATLRGACRLACRFVDFHSLQSSPIFGSSSSLVKGRG